MNLKSIYLFSRVKEIHSTHMATVCFMHIISVFAFAGNAAGGEWYSLLFGCCFSRVNTFYLNRCACLTHYPTFPYEYNPQKLQLEDVLV